MTSRKKNKLVVSIEVLLNFVRLGQGQIISLSLARYISTFFAANIMIPGKKAQIRRTIKLHLSCLPIRQSGFLMTRL